MVVIELEIIFWVCFVGGVIALFYTGSENERTRSLGGRASSIMLPISAVLAGILMFLMRS